MFQNPSATRPGIPREMLLEGATQKRAAQLSESYTIVSLTSLQNKNLVIPETTVKISGHHPAINHAYKKEYEWLEVVKKTFENRNSEIAKNTSWAAFHASELSNVNVIPSITALLPLFCEGAHSAAMVRHGLDVIKQAVDYLNPGQVPVVAMDQPLYALAKQIQW